MRHREIAANGITLHFVEHGEGPVILFCHGFPAIWSSWRAQMEAMAAVGYKAVALDMRGYGLSSAPVNAEAYTPYETVGDLVAVLDSLEERTAILVGHDFGSNVVWNAAMMRPDRFLAVCSLSVQFRSPGGPSFLDKLRAAGKEQFYWFSMMRPESDLAWSEAAITVPGMLYWTSGDAPEGERWDPFEPERGLLRPAPADAPIVATNAGYIEDAVASFERTGFHGALNYYRSVDPFTLHSQAFSGARISQPSMFLAGSLDGLNLVAPPDPEAMRTHLTGLRSFTLLDGVGHWPHLEAPDDVNKALIAFLVNLPERSDRRQADAEKGQGFSAAWQIDHAAVRVPVLDDALAWYTTKLDCKLTRTVRLGSLTFALLHLTSDPGFHFELMAGAGLERRAIPKDLQSSYQNPGWHHAGFQVPSVDEVISELKRRGVTIVSEPHDVAVMGLRVGFFEDPWGNLFEVVEPLRVGNAHG